MSVYKFKLPDIGEGIAEAEIVAWHVKVGDKVEEDQQIADMMTDKATVEMESPVAGVVRKLAGEVGDQIAIGSVLVEIETEGGAPVAEDAPAPAVEQRSLCTELYAEVLLTNLKTSASVRTESGEPRKCLGWCRSPRRRGRRWGR